MWAVGLKRVFSLNKSSFKLKLNSSIFTIVCDVLQWYIFSVNLYYKIEIIVFMSRLFGALFCSFIDNYCFNTLELKMYIFLLNLIRLLCFYCHSVNTLLLRYFCFRFVLCVFFVCSTFIHRLCDKVIMFNDLLMYVLYDSMTCYVYLYFMICV